MNIDEDDLELMRRASSRLLAPHHRWIKITRANGSQARLLIGRGLSFIQPNGSVLLTFVVVEEL